MPAHPRRSKPWMAPEGPKGGLQGGRHRASWSPSRTTSPRQQAGGPVGRSADSDLSYVVVLAMRIRPGLLENARVPEPESLWAKEAKESDDPRKRALAASAEGNFHLAARDSPRRPTPRNDAEEPRASAKARIGQPRRLLLQRARVHQGTRGLPESPQSPWHLSRCARRPAVAGLSSMTATCANLSTKVAIVKINLGFAWPGRQPNVFSKVPPRPAGS